MIKKEISDALYVLLHCSLKDKEYETQTDQFYCVYGYIKQLEEVIEEVKKIVEKTKYGWPFNEFVSKEDLWKILDKAKEDK